MLLRVALVLAALSSAARAEDVLAAQEAQQQALFEKVTPSVVYVSAKERFGSGFFISHEGLILTNAHVVEDATTVTVVLHDGRRVEGTVVERGEQRIDVALVQVPLKDTPTLPQGSVSEVKVGSWVAAIGHGRGAVWTFNTGMVSNIYPDGAERPVFQTQIPLNPGNSGGPIFDRRGRIIGIVTAGIADASSINFGIGMEIARRSLSRLAASCDCLTVEAPEKVPVFVNGKMAGTGPRIVIMAEPRAYEVFAVINGKMRKASVKYPETKLVKLQTEEKPATP
jgi:S1-C subfamily serine protease